MTYTRGTVPTELLTADDASVLLTIDSDDSNLERDIQLALMNRTVKPSEFAINRDLGAALLSPGAPEHIFVATASYIIRCITFLNRRNSTLWATAAKDGHSWYIQFEEDYINSLDTEAAGRVADAIIRAHLDAKIVVSKAQEAGLL